MLLYTTYIMPIKINLLRAKLVTEMLQVITKREEGIERSLSMRDTTQECLILRIVLIL